MNFPWQVSHVIRNAADSERERESERKREGERRGVKQKQREEGFELRQKFHRAETRVSIILVWSFLLCEMITFWHFP